jgi:hypothetical protein
LVCIAPQVLVNQLGGKPVQCALPQWSSEIDCELYLILI